MLLFAEIDARSVRLHGHNRAEVAEASDQAIPVGESGVVPAALAVPERTRDARPAVIVLHELTGLNADIRRICRRFADAGYVALAPDFLHGLGARPLCMVRFMRGLAEGGDGEPFRRLDAARRWLAARDDVDGAQIGVAGFCIGGGFALLYSVHADVAVVAPFYAAVPKEPERELRGLCPVVASYGARDRIFGPAAPRLARALDTLSVAHDVKSYAQAGHSFMNERGGLLGWLARRTPLHAGYHGPSAEDAWARTLDFFARYLVPED